MRAGQCVVVVKLIDHLVHITAKYVSGASDVWITTARGQSVFLSDCLFTNLSVSIQFFCWSIQINHLLIFRISNCVGELNQKYFIQFLFYTGKFQVTVM